MINETWSDRWPDHLWLKRFRRRCRRDEQEGTAPIPFRLNEPLIPRSIPRRIWLYWHQGWRQAPAIVQLCRASWVANNPEWEIIFLDSENEAEFVGIACLTHDKTMGIAARSDLIRLSLLSRYGGVWADATTVCAVPLSHWLPHLLQSGFFAYSRPDPDRLLATWFLASEKGGYIVERWFALAQRYWHLVSEADHYFWVHYLFAEGCRADPTMRGLWAATPWISADGAHAVQRRPWQTEGIDDLLHILDERRIPVHKLSTQLPVPTEPARAPLRILLEPVMGGRSLERAQNAFCAQNRS